MRRLALVLSLSAIVLALCALARAQPGLSGAELVLAGERPVVVDTVWRSGRGGRRARVTAAALGTERELFDGSTVRTAAAARADALAVVAFHGGDAPFVRLLVAPIDDGGVGAPVTVELSRTAASSRSDELRPAAAVVTATPTGFAALVQEQGSDPSADVVTTMTSFDPTGVILSGPSPVAVPWQLGALAARPDGTFELVVVYGGGSTPEHPVARACVVSLDAAGHPTEHPWWASDTTATSDIHVAIALGAIVVAWRVDDGDEIRATRWTSDGGWSRPPTAIESLARIDPRAPFALDAGGAVVTP